MIFIEIMVGKGLVIGKKAPDFTLKDQNGSLFQLSTSITLTPAVLIFYPGDFTFVCTKQLCDYRDHIDRISSMGVQLFGISRNSVAEHAEFAGQYKFPFLLLSDPEQNVAKQYGCASLFMLGKISRALFIVNTKGFVLYRYVEPTVLTRRTSDELLGILKDLKGNKLL